jgi:hypothetical protein
LLPAFFAIVLTLCHAIRCRKNLRRFDSRRLQSLNQESSNDFQKSETLLGVTGECSTGADCLSEAVSVSSFAFTLAYIAERSPYLQPHIREAILTLVDTSERSVTAEGERQ